jgi:hypothetical protein
MKLFRHPGLLIALVWVAAMALTPIAAASGASRGTDQLPGQAPPDQGMNQAPGNGQEFATPGQGIPPGIAGNQSGHSGPQDRLTGNMTAPPGIPGGDATNSTAPQEFGNMTPPPFPPEGNTSNAMALNRTLHGPAGNQSATVPGQGNGVNPGQQQSQNSLLDEFFSWL